MTILLSIIIPVFNRQVGLDNLTKSLVSSTNYQKFKNNIEVIIIDDASSSKIKVPSNLLCHVKHSRNEINIGAPKSRQKGFQLSSGKFIHFHDSDDRFSSSWLKDIMLTLQQNKNLDLLITARKDISLNNSQYRFQKYAHQHQNNINKIKRRLVYRNCLGPLGGNTFSRVVIQTATFSDLPSSQDWQMYLDIITKVKHFKSLPKTYYHFYIDGDDRISNNPIKKIRGYMQLSRITSKSSIFGRNIRFYYLYLCREYIDQEQGLYKKYYDKNKVRILFWYITITVYWNLFS
jgi:glycosyltransferase involved in cell wall biosynthesis